MTGTAFKKAAVPNGVRRAVAVRYECPPGGSTFAPCHYCGEPGLIHWHRLYSGEPSYWVSFAHEIDHVIPEFHGGPTTAENLVLACRRCNRSKGTKRLPGAAS